MRGKARLSGSCRVRVRITPAYAGKSFKITCYNVPNKDHPRLCGEKEADVQFLRHSLGSPPPMRGKGQKDRWEKVPRRITPAYAGKRWFALSSNCPCQDHPRLCGEKMPAGSVYSIVRGSPPPMRGKAGKSIDKRHKSRITPAYAGKSRIDRCSNRRTWDHPRLCGEKLASM